MSRRCSDGLRWRRDRPDRQPGLRGVDGFAGHAFGFTRGDAVVSVWGATHPGLGFFGYGCDPRGIVQADMECRPCSVFGNKPCRYGDYRCLHAVTPAMIVERVEEIVGK